MEHYLSGVGGSGGQGNMGEGLATIKCHIKLRHVYEFVKVGNGFKVGASRESMKETYSPGMGGSFGKSDLGE